MCNSTDEHPGCILNTEVNLGKCVWEPFHEMIVRQTICVCDSTNRKTKPPSFAVPTLTSAAKTMAIWGWFFPLLSIYDSLTIGMQCVIVLNKKIGVKSMVLPVNGFSWFHQWLLRVCGSLTQKFDLQQLGWWWAMCGDEDADKALH